MKKNRSVAALLLTALLTAPCETASAQTVSPADSPYGACAHITRFPNDRVNEWPERVQTCATLADAGVGWVRSDFDYVMTLDRIFKDGSTARERYDDMILCAETNHLQFLPIITTPKGRAITDPEVFVAWTNKIVGTVTYYKARLSFWEIINEPDIESKGFLPGTNYLHHLRAAAAAVRSADPDAVLLSSGWAFITSPHVQEAYNTGAGAFFDIHNIHLYTYPDPPEPIYLKHVETFIELLRKNNCADKPVWVTECGWPTAPEDVRSATEACAALWLPRGHLTFFALGVEKVFIYEWRAPEWKPQEREHHFGIHHWDFSPKPSVRALRTLIQERPAGSVQLLEKPWRNAADHTATIFWPQWRRPSGETAGAIWCHEAATNGPALHVTFDAAPAFRDYLGKPVTLTPESDGSYRIPRAPDVLYFRGANLLTAPN